MRITKISVKGLFSMFDHEIPLNQESRITIIHGPNGVGKTVLLKLVHALFHYDYELLEKIPFEQLRVEFADGDVVIVERHELLDQSDFEQLLIELATHEGEIEEPVEDIEVILKETVFLSFNYDDVTGKRHSSFLPAVSTSTEDEMREILEGWRPELRFVRMGDRAWWVDADSRVYSKEDMLREYPLLHNLVYGQLPEWLESLQQAPGYGQLPTWLASRLQVPVPGLISTRRLHQDNLTPELLTELETLRKQEEIKKSLIIRDLGDAVRGLSDDLDSKIENLNYTPEAIEKLKRGDVENVSIEIGEANAKFAQLNHAIVRFERENVEALNREIGDIKEGLLEEIAESGSFEVKHLLELGLDEELAKDIAALDVQERLDDLKDDQLDWGLHLALLTNIRDFGLSNLLLDFVNERFLFKTLERTEGNEFKFIANDGSGVSFSALSSGEQNFLILYHHLLFQVQPSTLVMIDEPELSFNVVWQRRFLNDLQRITEQCKFDVLIATHSPMIIHDKWDWVVHLGEKVDD